MLNVFDGQITQADGLRDALEGILSAKAVQNGVLRIQSDLVSGRVGIFCARFITGAQVDSTGESGGLALRRLLAARNGSFSFEDARGSDISDLKQSLSIDVEILLENMTQLLDGKSVTLSDGSMFGFAMPAQRIKKPTGEDAAPAAAPPMPLPTAVPQGGQQAPAPAPAGAAAPTKLSAQWKLLAGQQGDAAAAGLQPPSPAAPPNGEAPRPIASADSTGDFAAVTAQSAAAAAAQMAQPSSSFTDVEPPPPNSPSLENEILPSDNTAEFDSLRLDTNEQQALEITGEFGTFKQGSTETHSEDIRYQAQISKPSSPQPKPAISVPTQAPGKLPQTPVSAPQPPAASTSSAGGWSSPSSEQAKPSIPQPAPASSTPNVFTEAAAAFASSQPPAAKSEFADFVSDLNSPAASPAPAPAPPQAQPGLIKPAANELDDFVSEMQSFNKEASAQPNQPQALAGNARSELDAFVAEMQGAAQQPAQQSHGLIKPAENELEDFAAEMRQHLKVPGQPAPPADVNPFNDEPIPPESGSFGIGDLFAATTPKKAPEPPPPPKPAQKLSGSEYTMADLFSSKQGGPKPPEPQVQQPQPQAPAPQVPKPQPQPQQPAQQPPTPPRPIGMPPDMVPSASSPSVPAPQSGMSSAAAAFAAGDETPLALSSVPPAEKNPFDKSPFSDGFSERSPGLSNESIRPSQPMSDPRTSRQSDEEAMRPSSPLGRDMGGGDALPSSALGNESIRPSQPMADASMRNSSFGSEPARPSGFDMDSKAANTLPSTKSQQPAAPLSGAAAGLPSEQSKSGGPLAGLPSQQGKATSDYQLPSQQKATGQTQQRSNSGQTMKSALNALPSMAGKNEDVQQQPQPKAPAPDDWPDDFPPPERMRRNTDAVQKPAEKPKQAEPTPAWDDPAFDPEELMRKRRERKGEPVDPNEDPFTRIAQTRANESASSDSRLRAIVEEGSSQSAFAPMAHPNSMVKSSAVERGPKPGFRKLNQWNSTGVMAVKIFGVLLLLGAGAGIWHVYGGTVMEAFKKMTAPPPPPAPPKPTAVTKPKTEPTTKKKTKRRRRRSSNSNR